MVVALAAHATRTLPGFHVCLAPLLETSPSRTSLLESVAIQVHGQDECRHASWCRDLPSARGSIQRHRCSPPHACRLMPTYARAQILVPRSHA